MRTRAALLWTITIVVLAAGEAGAARHRVPLSFEANRGQSDPAVTFLARGPGYDLFLTPTETLLRTRAAAIRMRLVGANGRPAIAGLERLPGQSHYFLGNDRRRWVTHVPHYATVRYRDVYPGIDALFYSAEGRLEYDFVLSPGADPRRIRLAFDGMAGAGLDGEGNLRLETADGPLIQHRPRLYQLVDGRRRPVAGGYRLRPGGGADGRAVEVAIWTGGYDPARPLIIDPIFSYSTYLGGSGAEIGHSVAVDNDGFTYVAGATTSTDFPSAVPVPGPAPLESSDNLFVTKIDPTGSMIVYSVHLGGVGFSSGLQQATAIAVDTRGAAYLTGLTDSADFPLLPAPNPIQPGGYGGGASDAFVTKLDEDGLLVYSTYLGGSALDEGLGIVADIDGHAYVTGRTASADFPTQDPHQPATGGGAADAFVARLDPEGDALLYSTYLGGSGDDRGNDLTIDNSLAIYVVGATSATDFPTTTSPDTVVTDLAAGALEVFVAKIGAAVIPASLIFVTYLGGSADDDGRAIEVDEGGRSYLTGGTASADYPTTASPFQSDQAGLDGFVSRLTPTGEELLYSTYLGGGGDDAGHNIDLDRPDILYVTGRTESDDFPLTADALQPAIGGGVAGVSDAFIAKFSGSGDLDYATYLGGSGDDEGLGIEVNSFNDIFITGQTDSADFPIVPAPSIIQPGGYGGGLSDAFLTVLTQEPPSGCSYSPSGRVEAGVVLMLLVPALYAQWRRRREPAHARRASRSLAGVERRTASSKTRSGRASIFARMRR